MGHSVRASAKGLEIVNQARQRRGWTKTSTACWWQDAHTSRATLRRFWRGERIQQAAFIAICQAVGLDDWSAIAEPPSETPSDTVDQSTLPPCPIDWGSAPDIEQFYGRQPELQQLQTWALTDAAKLINISGLGGSGKTALALALVEQIQAEFEGVIWRSVQRSPSIETLLADLVDAPIETVDWGMRQLLKKMQRRWLLILDDWDAALPDPYPDVLYDLTCARHHSCIVVVSRQLLPAKFQVLKRVRHLSIEGLSIDAAVRLLQHCGCDGPPSDFNALARLYGHNPLALKMVAFTIQSLFGGQIVPFLEQGGVISTDPIRPLLQQQFAALTPLEKTILFWLAIWQEPIAFCRLQTHLLEGSDPTETISALSTLAQQSLITRHFLSDEPSFGLPPLISAFAVHEFVEAALGELLQAQQQQSIQGFCRLRTHCLLRPGADDILGDRILTTLQETYQKQVLQSSRDWIDPLLQQARNEPPRTVGYLVFNLSVLKEVIPVGRE